MIESIIKSFDIWTDAQGLKSKGRVKSIENISLEGIARLRELILQLAVMGKLVKQNPTDEPASELIKRITKEKVKLLKEGKIKKQPPLTDIKDDEKPFELHKSWAWYRLQDLVSILGDGIHGTPEYIDNGDYYFINGNNLNDGIIDIKTNTKTISKKEYDKHKRDLSDRTILVSINGTIGNTAYYNNEKIILGKSACYFNLLNDVNKEYIRLLLKTKYFIYYALSEATGTTIKNVSLQTMRSFVIPLPPFSEQKRIVKKVDELMTLCDKLEKEQFSKLKTHQILVKTLLETLTQAKDADELQASWQRLSAHFDTLFCTDDSIDQLKQTILQLAVMGKLVKQNPTDEPASELLKQITKEKDKLIKEGKINKEKSLPPIELNENPYLLPVGWIWCRLADISILINGDRGKNYPSKEYYVEEGVPFLTAANLGERFLNYDSLNFITEERFALLSNGKVQPNDILYCLRGSLGKCSIVDRINKGAIASSLCIVRSFSGINHDLLINYFLSPLGKDMIKKHDNGTAQPNLSAADVKTYLFPLPPVAEQMRIVKKIEELFALCDTLNEKIQKSQDIKILLSKTIVEKAIK